MKKDFLWGVSSAAYQVEGAYNEGGKGLSIWDEASHTKGRIFAGQTADVSCDEYHLFKDDVKLMREMGVKAYRFSISWPRILPDGSGKVNEEGVKYYRELLTELKKANIIPVVTLYHWDLPLKLFEKGGFLNPDISDVFADYAETVVKELWDLIDYYIIFNEMQVVVEDGHFTGAHAPFLRLSRENVFKVAHNVLLCIGKAEKRMRKAAGRKIKIGVAPCFTPAIPKNPEDVELAREFSFAPTGDFYDGCFFTDALILGKFADNYLPWFKEYGYNPTKEDLKIIKSDLDFFGFNNYFGIYVENENGKAVRAKCSPQTPLNALKWQITPEAPYYGAKFYYERYKLPIIFTENGIPLSEWKLPDGTVADDYRIDFMRKYIGYIKKAAEEVPIDGYFYWCFSDNFEWALGYSARFGLVYVDYETQERTVKKSGYWYKKVIASNGEDLT